MNLKSIREMPSRALRPCTQPGCPRLVKSGRCEEHAVQQARFYDAQRPSARQRGYDARHEEWRQRVFARDRNCRGCGAPGHPSDHADHIVRIRDGGARFDLNNGQRLCRTCHNSEKQTAERRR